MAGFWRRFRDANVALSHRLMPPILWQTRGFAIYDWVARALLADETARVILDVGGGRTWHFDRLLDRPGLRIIGIDVSDEELRLNTVIDEAIVADVSKTIPLPDASVDLILCRVVIEHLPDVETFLANAARVLKPGGRAAFAFANKWAPPMILNRMLSHTAANAILERLLPNAKGYGGFRAYYDRCTYRQFEEFARRVGLINRYGYCSYYSSAYFQFFLPLHLLSIALDMVRTLLSVRLFSSMNIFVLQRPLPGEPPSVVAYSMNGRQEAPPPRTVGGLELPVVSPAI